MQKLINKPERVIEEMLDGLLALYPDVARLAGHKVLLRADAEERRERQVAIISGGGSGHEPAHAGYIGTGMLSAAVAGEIFTSPSAASVLAAIRAVTGRLGALLIVKNYTGDRLNFGLAAEMARAEGLLIETVIVADDVALAGSDEHAGRRGIAGTVLVHKIAGAAAVEEKDLPQVASIAQAAAENLGTMGVALSAGTSPVASGPAFTLDREVELGLGIHGEPGVRRIPIRPANELVEELLQKITSELQLRAGERIAVLINNLGATTAMEMAIVGRKTLSALKARSLGVDRLYAGTFVSSLDMAGISISLLRVDEERLRWLDAPTSAPAWPNVSKHAPGSVSARVIERAEEEPSEIAQVPETELGARAERAIAAGCNALIDAEDRLSQMDQAVGDGDLGLNMTRAATELQRSLRTFPLDHPAELLKRLGAMLQGILGGSSGPLYGVLLLRTGSSLEAGSSEAHRPPEAAPSKRGAQRNWPRSASPLCAGSLDPRLWAAAMIDGCNAIGELGGARPGDCTMLDALFPFARTFAEQLRAGSSWRDSLSSGVRAARRGAEQTAHMIARRGRSSYLGKRSIGFADPGAMAVAIWLEAAAREIAR